jgi:predicted ATPase
MPNVSTLTSNTTVTHPPGSTIRTPDQRLRVFISSTIEELAPERKAAQKSIKQMGMIPVLFELGARPYPPRDLYTAYLEQSNVFIGIYWEKYGWVAPDMTISGLEDEFRLSHNMPRLIYIKSSKNRDPRLQELINEMANAGLSYKSFHSEAELNELILNDLAILLTENFKIIDPVPKRLTSFLPIPTTSLLGREKETAELVSKIISRESRLITLTGPGGVGKTRLVLEVAHKIKDKFEDGVFFVRLSSVRDAELVPAAVFRIIFPDEASGNNPVELLVSKLRGKQACIILDNFEQVISAANFIIQLLQASPDIIVIVTSRETLLLKAENEYPVKPLPLVQHLENSDDNLIELVKDHPSVQLFVQRCKAIKPEFELSKTNVSEIAHICNALEGLPLAIELAAARIKLFTPRAIVKMLNKKLDFLHSNWKDRPDRHQTLRATIEWSYNLLTESEKELFAYMAVFPGGFNLDTLQGMIDVKQEPQSFPRLGMFLSVPLANTLEDIELTEELSENTESLLSKNLIYTRTDRTGERRFHLYQTVREFALEILEKEGRLHEMNHRHLLYYIRLTESIYPRLLSKESLQWMALLDEELPNITSALSFALEAAPMYGLRIAVAIGEYWDTRANTTDGIWWLSEFLKKSYPDSAELTKPGAVALLEMSRLYFRDQEINNLNGCLEKLNRYVTNHDDEYVRIDIVSFKMMTTGYAGKEEAAAIFEEALATAKKLNYEMEVLNLLQSAAAGAVFSGAPDKGHKMAEETLVLAKKIGAARWIAISKVLLGFSELLLGKLDEARITLIDCCKICDRINDRIIIIHPLIGVAQIAILTGQVKEGAQLFGFINRFIEQPGITPVQGIGALMDSVRKGIESMLTNEEKEFYYNKGYVMKNEELIPFINQHLALQLNQ